MSIESSALEEKISRFCQQDLSPLIDDVDRLEEYLVSLASRRDVPPSTARGYGWRQIATQSHTNYDQIIYVKKAIRYALDAIKDHAETPPPATKSDESGELNEISASPDASGRSLEAISNELDLHQNQATRRCENPAGPTVRGLAPDNLTFAQSLRAQMAKHGDSCSNLARKLRAAGMSTRHTVILKWLNGVDRPTKHTYDRLRWISTHYKLGTEFFIEKIGPVSPRRFIGIERFYFPDIPIVARHVPGDFNHRDAEQRKHILDWIQKHVITIDNRYRRYLSETRKHKYIYKFPAAPVTLLDEQVAQYLGTKSEIQLDEEFGEDVPAWSATTLDIIKIRLGVVFGALSAQKGGYINGLAVPIASLSLALVVFPRVWRWFMRWIKKRRGFYTSAELNTINIVRTLLQPTTGWLRNNPWIVDNVEPIDEVISADDIDHARRNWQELCNDAQITLARWARVVTKYKRVSRDSREIIAQILATDAPYVEYYKIAEEIIRQTPDIDVDPTGAAECSRSYLMIRLGLHLGLRQKNLRELLICPRGNIPSTEEKLTTLKRGEIRWIEERCQWEVFIPHTAFKNALSSFFKNRPWRYYLEDIDGLFAFIDTYLKTHRKHLLSDALDPSTFFVRTITRKCRSAAFSREQFFRAWFTITQIYGVYNPFTGRGAIKGLIPHGPHAVRHVVATQVIKSTRDFRLAGYAIQDLPLSVERFYGDLLPEEKAATAAKILNEIFARSRHSVHSWMVDEDHPRSLAYH